MARRGTVMPVTRVFLVALLALAGCAIVTDDQPRDIPPNDRLDLNSANKTPAVQSGDTSAPKVYFLTTAALRDGARLVAASRSVNPLPVDVVDELLKGQSAEERTRRWRTAIPVDTKLRSATINSDGTLSVDLDDAFFKATGDAQVEAVAQIVFTGAAIAGVKQVQILVAGNTSEWPRGDGTRVAGPLTPLDFPELNPNSQPDFPPQPSPTAAGTSAVTTTAATTTTLAPTPSTG